MVVLIMLTAYAFQQRRIARKNERTAVANAKREQVAHRAADENAAEAKRQEAIANENAQKERMARNAAETQAWIAESRRLAAESSSVLTQYPQRSLLLAVEAAKIGERVVAANQSLREALAHVGGRPLGATSGPIKVVRISPDSRWLVTYGYDKTAQLWDLSAKIRWLTP
jgi:hypothetical protein